MFNFRRNGGLLVENKDAINPDHYRKYPIDIIDMMVAIFGIDKTISHCVMTAFKYRMRLGHKDDVKQEMAKEQWYLDKAKELEKLKAK